MVPSRTTQKADELRIPLAAFQENQENYNALQLCG
jgi:hypothetical protein